MNRLYLIAAIPFALVVMVTAIRLLIPFNVPESQYVTPGVQPFPAREDRAGELERILEHNLFDQSRQPVRLPEPGKAGGPSSGPGPDGSNPHEQRDGETIRLLGVSFVRGDSFVVIESSAGPERYEVGDLLPDGTRLKAIDDYGILVSDSEHNERYYLFGK